MSFSIFTNGSLAISSEINNNFYNLYNGDFIPRSGQSLASSDGINNLGGSANYFENCYVNSISSFYSLTSNYYLAASYSGVFSDLLFEDIYNETIDTFLKIIIFTYHSYTSLIGTPGTRTTYNIIDDNGFDVLKTGTAIMSIVGSLSSYSIQRDIIEFQGYYGDTSSGGGYNASMPQQQFSIFNLFIPRKNVIGTTEFFTLTSSNILTSTYVYDTAGSTVTRRIINNQKKIEGAVNATNALNRSLSVEDYYFNTTANAANISIYIYKRF